MPLLADRDWKAASAIAEMGYCNPFLPERVKLEREALGREAVPDLQFRQWRPNQSLRELFPHLPLLAERAAELATRLRERLASGASATPNDLLTYEDLALVSLYLRFMTLLGLGDQGISRVRSHGAREKIEFWPEFLDTFRFHFEIPGQQLPSGHNPAHAFAVFYQIERAYFHIFKYIIGGSKQAADLRAEVWESIFTHDMRRYSRTLYDRMQKIPTLIMGPSGSGKELVARAVGLSRYIPFDPKSQMFQSDFAGDIHAVNVAAFAPTVVESELFGHKKGAFTGAVADRAGWLEQSDDLGTVFLDEVGEIDPTIQVKLLRVLQEQKFQRLGETKDREFKGKIVAATNRDLALEMREDRFREDLYYRLCADIVTTPSLKEQLKDNSDDLPNLVRFVVAHVVGENEQEQEVLTSEVVDWIHRELTADYAWPGNFRELEQCVRNVLVRRRYQPAVGSTADPADTLAADIRAAALTSDELLRRYYAIVKEHTGSYKAAARRLEVDRRTVRRRLSEES